MIARKARIPIVFLTMFVLACGCRPRKEIVTVSGTHYEMNYYLPARWETRLDEWDEYYTPPDGERFVWVYVLRRSVSANPIELRREDFVLHYRLGQTLQYTTTLVATGNNDVYLLARDRDYGGLTDERGYGQRYVFSVPEDAYDFVLEISSMPPVSLSVR